MYDLESGSGPLEQRLSRIERLLQQLVPNGGAMAGNGIGHGVGARAAGQATRGNGERLSSSTYVDDSARGIHAGDHLEGKAADEGSGLATSNRFAREVVTTPGQTTNNAQTQLTHGTVPPSMDPHHEPHSAFVSGVAGDGGRPHVDFEPAKEGRM